MSGRHIDVNADLGESFGRWVLGDDLSLLPSITSANVACGFHAGDPATLRTTVAAAAESGVVIGAQVSYPDLVGFGRRPMDIAPVDLEADVVYQIGALDGLCRVAGTRVRYVKAHGALYHRTLADQGQADAVAAAVAAYDDDLAIVTMDGRALAEAARRRGIRVIREGFADRAYTDAGDLVPRSVSGAVIGDPAVAGAQAVRLASEGLVDSICVHGDTPGAPEIAATVRQSLTAAGWTLASFA